MIRALAAAMFALSQVTKELAEAEELGPEDGGLGQTLPIGGKYAMIPNNIKGGHELSRKSGWERRRDPLETAKGDACAEHLCVA